MIKHKPKRIVNGILDYIGDTEDEFIENYEKISEDYYGRVSIETQVILNCCDLLIQNFQRLGYGKGVIDVGCGAGYVINNISLENKVALDISLNQLLQVNKNITRIRANAEDIPICSSYFSVVICTDLFEHTRDEKALVSELHRILAPGGMLLFASPWKQDLLVYDSNEYKKKFKQYKYMHLRTVNEETITKDFSSFDVKSSTMITAAMSSMHLKPYSIKFVEFRKK